jgi:hypothetical protein
VAGSAQCNYDFPLSPVIRELNRPIDQDTVNTYRRDTPLDPVGIQHLYGIER